MKKDFTQIAVILDRSGSMADVRKQTIDNFNEFVNQQKLVPGEARLRLVQFDHEYQYMYDKPLNLVEPLTETMFVPRGSTALIDAIGRTVEELGIALANYRERDRPDKVIVLILTDGYENSSTQYNKESGKSVQGRRIAAMIKHQREVYKWMFIFMGATEDAVTVAQSYNIPMDNAIYTHSSAFDPAAGMSGTISASNLMTSYRTTGKIGSFTTTDRTASAGTTAVPPLPVTTEDEKEGAKI